MLPCKLLIIPFLICSTHSTNLYRFGEDQGDQKIPFSREPYAFTSDVTIPYFSESQDEENREMFISSNGAVSFGNSIGSDEVKDLDRERTSSIAVFYVPTTAGTIYYRSASRGSELLNDLQNTVQKNFKKMKDFRPVHCILITWDGMQTKDPSQGTNQFQLAMVTDGVHSFALFLYGRIEWTTAEGLTAQAGMYFKDGRRQIIIYSGTDDMRKLATSTNNYVEGTHIYEISSSTPNEPGSPGEDDYNYSEYNEQDYDPEDGKRQNELSPECPLDPYRDRCPPECEILTDDRGCSQCVCAQPPSLSRQDGSGNDISDSTNKQDPIPHQHGYERTNQDSERRMEPAGSETENNRAEMRPDAHQYSSHAERPPEKHHSAPVEQQSYHPSLEAHESHSQDSMSEEQSLVPHGENQPQYSRHEQEMPHQQYHPNQLPEEEQLHPPRLGEGASVISGNNAIPDSHFETPLSCSVIAQTEQRCRSNAQCVDYNPGFCCQCLPEFYGNGQECLKKGESQRLTGKVHGAINGEQLENNDLHIYALTADGRAHTAISGISSSLGHSLLLLDPIGSIVGWLFAKVESPSSYNGFDLTGGIFNRTATVHVGDRSVVTIKQECTGRDRFNHLNTKIFVAGTLPLLSDGAKVVYPNHEEEYRREGPGFLRSYSTYDVIITDSNKERTIKLLVDQQIHFDECPYKEFDKEPAVIIRVSRPHVVYDAVEQIIRYASVNIATYRKSHTSSIEAVPEYSPQSQDPRFQPHEHQHNPSAPRQNPCVSGQHYCKQPHMFCTPVEPSYRCECERGFHPQIDASVTLGWRCIDIDECERREYACDPNAFCRNTDGGYECECNPGFQGDGHQCQRLGGDPGNTVPETVAAAGCTTHQQCHQWGECVFGQNGQPGYCKCRGWYVGDGVNHCGPPGEPAPTQRRPHVANLCGGYTCDANAECMSAPQGGDECVCRNGFYGNGVQCFSHTEPTHPPTSASAVGMVCRSHGECGDHANCVYGNEVGYYRCVCIPPYVGDGTNCQLPPGSGGPAERPEQCDRANNCGPNAQCVADGYGNFICRCIAGFDGDGFTCTPIHSPPPQGVQTCRDQSDCHQNAHCVVRENAAQHFCECLPGYKGDGINECSVAEECDPSDPNSCHQHAECVYGQYERAYVCKCIAGFAGDGKLCTAQPDRTCDGEPAICHHNAQCMYNDDEGKHHCICRPGFVGDGYNNCEMQVTRRCSSCSVHASCVEDTDGAWKCKCNPGYQGNGHLCTRYMSCLDDRSMCDVNAECVPGADDNYVCNCHYGYHGNGKVCIADSEGRDEMLLIGRGMAIIQRGTNPELPGKQLVVIPHQIVVGIDFDCQEERIVWSDISGHAIRSASLNGTDEKKYFESVLMSPEGIAVDWASRNFYYTDSMKDEIGVATLNGKYQKALIKEGLVNPRALALDLTGGHLFYSDWHRQNPLIGRMNLDGSNNVPFVNTDIHLPNGLAVLEGRRELCWVDAGMQRLSCIGLNGRHRRVVFAPLEYPFGLTVHNEQRFYWTDWRDHQIHSVSITGTAYATFPATIGGSGRMYGIVSVPMKCKGSATACSLNNGGCKYICVTIGTQAKCLCPDNVADLEGC